MKTLTTLILRRPSRNQHMQKPSLKSNSYFFSSNRHQNFLRGCTRLALNSTSFLQDFKLPGRCAEIKSKFAFFQEQREGFAIDSVVFSQDAFCLIPKIFNAVNVVLTVCKFLGMVDAVMDKTAHVQLVVTAQTIGINNTVRHNFPFDNRHQSIGSGIVYDNGIDSSVAFQNAEDNHFSYRPRPRLPLRRPPK